MKLVLLCFCFEFEVGGRGWVCICARVEVGVLWKEGEIVNCYHLLSIVFERYG